MNRVIEDLPVVTLNIIMNCQFEILVAAKQNVCNMHTLFKYRYLKSDDFIYPRFIQIKGILSLKKHSSSYTSIIIVTNR